MVSLEVYQSLFIFTVALCCITTEAFPRYITDRYYPYFNARQIAEEPIPMDTKRSKIAERYYPYFDARQIAEEPIPMDTKRSKIAERYYPYFNTRQIVEEPISMDTKRSTIAEEYYPYLNPRQMVENPFMDIKRSGVAPDSELYDWYREGKGDINDFSLMNLMNVERRGGQFNNRRGRPNAIIPFYWYQNGVNYLSDHGNDITSERTSPYRNEYGLRRHPSSIIYGDYPSGSRKLRRQYRL